VSETTPYGLSSDEEQGIDSIRNEDVPLLSTTCVFTPCDDLEVAEKAEITRFIDGYWLQGQD